MQEHRSLLFRTLSKRAMIDPMAGTPRDRARARTMADIVRIGRQHLASDGAAALSLRAVARDLGVVSSAVYRYVKSRDELLTLLVVDGYDELGDAVDRALADVAADDFLGRQKAIARAVRAWGLAEPATYALLFGGPVPGYRAPAEQTTVPGTRVVFALVRVWSEAYAAGRLVPPTLEVTSPGVDRPLTEHRHWRRAVGRLVQVQDGDRPVTGRVVEAAGAGVTLDVDGTRREIAWGELGRGRVQVEFNRGEED